MSPGGRGDALEVSVELAVSVAVDLAPSVATRAPPGAPKFRDEPLEFSPE
jgi:hypothetical protein